MKNLLEFILIHFVSHPDDVVIEEINDDQGTEYQVSVHQDDIAKVIGRKGRVIRAIRKLSQVKAVKDGVRVRITLND